MKEASTKAVSTIVTGVATSFISPWLILSLVALVIVFLVWVIKDEDRPARLAMVFRGRPSASPEEPPPNGVSSGDDNSFGI